MDLTGASGADRLHRDLVALLPGGAPRALTAKKAKALRALRASLAVLPSAIFWS